MAQETIEKSLLNPKVLGTVAILGSPMMLIEFLLEQGGGLPGGQFGRVEGALGIIYLIGFLSSALGLRILKATGKGTLAAVLFWIQIIGLSLAACQSILQMIGRADSSNRFFRIADAAWPLSHVFLLVIGIAVLFAKMWSGWRRLTPFFCGIALPLALGAGAAGGRESLGAAFGILTATSFMLLGCAIRTSGGRTNK